MMDRFNKKDGNKLVMVLYFICFLVVWFVKNLWFDPIIEHTLSPLPLELMQCLVKVIIWCGFALVFIKKYNDLLWVPAGQLFKGKIVYKDFFLYVGIFIIYNLVSVYRVTGSIGISPNFHVISLIGGFLIVGITEELVFRGWLLNFTLSFLSKNKAMGINAILFLVIHFPIWIRNGVFIKNFTSGSFLIIIVLSLLFSERFIQTKNLKESIFLHMLWDLVVMLLMGS